MSPYTCLVRRVANPFEMAHVLVSWLVGASYDAYVVVGCATRDTCLNLRYRTVCPELPDETEVKEEETEPEEAPRYKLVPLPDFSSKYVKMMEDRALQAIQDEIDRKEAERQLMIKELEEPPPDAIDGWRTHAWVLIMPGPMGVEKPFFIEPAEGNAYPLKCTNYQQIDSIYNHENYYVNLQTLRQLDEDEWEAEEFYEKELKDAEEREEREGHRKAKTEEEAQKRTEYRDKLDKDAATKEKEKIDAKDEALQDEKAKQKKKDEQEEQIKKSEGANVEIEELKKKNLEEKERLAKEKEEGKKKKKKKKVVEEEKVEEEQVEEIPKKIVWQNLSHLSYDLSNLSLWEHLLPGEPFNRRVLVGVDTSDKRTAVATERHLDMPESWVEKLEITAGDFEQRYPGCHKTIHYKKVLLEKFSRYSQTTGIVKRISVFEDYALTKPVVTYEYFNNREDKMNSARIDHLQQEVRELFDIGRGDHLLKHTYSLSAPPLSIEGNRTFEFKWYARLDHMEKVVCTPLSFEEYFKDRSDLLVSRNIIYTEGTKLEPKRRLFRITEMYKRNYQVPAKKDVWKRIFNIANGTVDLLYHYAYNFVTNDTRNFIKPNLAETGGKILFYPEKTSGYIADPCATVPRNLDVYMTLCENVEWEEKTTKHVREYQMDMNNILAQRYKELTEPSIYVSLFNTERNIDALNTYLEMQRMLAEQAEREKEADADPLQPYIARMFGVPGKIKQPLSVKQATLVREQCINDFKARQLARQLLVQERFDTLNAEYKAKRLWYLANQFILTPEKETAYFALSAELSFSVHTLEVRLSRHRDLSAPRYQVIETYLNKHPLLAEYNRMKAYYRKN